MSPLHCVGAKRLKGSPAYLDYQHVCGRGLPLHCLRNGMCVFVHFFVLMQWKRVQAARLRMDVPMRDQHQVEPWMSNICGCYMLTIAWFFFVDRKSKRYGTHSKRTGLLSRMTVCKNILSVCERMRARANVRHSFVLPL